MLYDHLEVLAFNNDHSDMLVIGDTVNIVMTLAEKNNKVKVLKCVRDHKQTICWRQVPRFLLMVLKCGFHGEGEFNFLDCSRLN